MKKILLLLLVTCYSFAQTGTTTAGQFKMTIPVAGANQDSVVVWNGTDKKLKFIGRSTFSTPSTPNLTEVLMVGNREVKQVEDFDNPAYTFIAEDKSKYCYSVLNIEFILDLANFNNGDEIVLTNNGFGDDFVITSADGLNIVVGSTFVDTVILPDGYTGYFKNFEGGWVFTKTTGANITPSTEPIVVSSNVTATLNREHNVTANATITDPTPTEGMGYPVNVINGVATVGGVAYGVGSELFRVYDGTDWVTYNKTGYIPLTGTTSGNPVSGDIEMNSFSSIKAENTTHRSVLNVDVDNNLQATIYTENKDTNDMAGLSTNSSNSVSLYVLKTSETQNVDINVTIDGIIVTDNGTTQRGLRGDGDYSANILDLDYTQKIYVDNQRGKLISLTNTEILAIASPEVARLYYNTTIDHVVYYNGTTWKKISNSDM